MNRSSLSFLLILPLLSVCGACDGSGGPGSRSTDAGPATGAGAIAEAPTFSCDTPGETLTFDLPCLVGLPIGGALSAMECSVHNAKGAGKWNVLVDLSTVASRLNQPIDLSTWPPTPPGTPLTLTAQGSVQISQVDETARTFAGRFVDVTFTLGDTASTLCRGQNRQLFAVAGQFL